MITAHTLKDEEALAVLRDSGATMARGYPSLLFATLRLAAERDVRLGLRLIATIGETVPPELRPFARERFDCVVLDSYGSTETGLIAAECPRCREYHLAHENMLVEVIRDDGVPALPGEAGRIVLTPFYNSAMPLIRYDIGDRVELGDGRGCVAPGVPTLRRIIGRNRNMFRLADGRRLVPMIPSAVSAGLGIRRFKLIQTSVTAVDFLYTHGDPAFVLPPAAVQRIIATHLDPSFIATPRRVPRLDPTASGKWFTCESFLD